MRYIYVRNRKDEFLGRISCTLSPINLPVKFKGLLRKNVKGLLRKNKSAKDESYKISEQRSLWQLCKGRSIMLSQLNARGNSSEVTIMIPGITSQLRPKIKEIMIV